MDADIDETSRKRPYGPPANIITILHRLRQRTLPSKIDAEFLRDLQISEGTITRAIFGLRFLKLIEEDGAPTPIVRAIAMSTDEEYQEILGGLVREAYSDVFERLDPIEDTQDKFRNFFRRYMPASQRERMVIFFLGMCREAGIQLADAPRPRANVTTSRATMERQAAKPKTASKGGTREDPSNNGAGQTQDTTGIHPALLLLVRSLPPESSALPKERRDQWLRMAEAALAFLYPEQDEGRIWNKDEEAINADL